MIFYDKNLLMLPDPSGKTIVYSALVNRRLRVNPPAAFLISSIISSGGDTSAPVLRDAFVKATGTEVDVDDVAGQLAKLEELGFLFSSKVALETSMLTVREKMSRREAAPLSLGYVHVTMRCNFNCVYCYNRDVEKDHTAELTTEEWTEAFKAMRAEGMDKLAITGGEPLVRKDIGALLAKAKGLGFTTTLLTNGSLLEQKFDEVVPHVGSIILSLDSHDEEHNKLNRSAFGFASILRVLPRLAKALPGRVTVRTVITKNNLADVKAFHSELKKKYGVARAIKLVFIPNKLEEVDLMPGVDEVYSDGDAELEAKPTLFYGCSAGRSILALSPNGDIYPCQNLVYPPFRMGNILSPGWRASMKSSAALSLLAKATVDNKGKCGDCAYKYLCGGGCPAIGYRAYGRLNEHLEFFCKYLHKEAQCRLQSSSAEWKELGGEN